MPWNHAAERDLVVIAANPYSGSDPNSDCVGALADALGHYKLEPRILWTAQERTAVLQDPTLPARCRCVVAAGGDGTVGAVINECAPVPLAVMPLGNENLFARHFGFTTDADALARIIAADRVRSIDLGRVGSRRFSLMVGVGLDADVVRRMARWRANGAGLKRVTRLSYVKPIFDALRRYPHREIEVVADGERVRGTHAFVFNLPQYALQLPLASEARDDDGALDWVVLQRPGSFNLMRYALAAKRGKHRRLKDVRCGRAQSISIDSSASVPVQVDGDSFGETPVTVQVLPGALKVAVP